MLFTSRCRNASRKRVKERSFRIEIGIKNRMATILEAIESMIIAEGARMCHGKAPRGYRVRQLAEDMQNLRLFRKVRGKGATEGEEDEDLY